jgi:hypothetical protein
VTSERYSWCELFVDAPSEADVLEAARRHFGLADDAGTFQLRAADVSVRGAQEWPSHPDHVEGWRGLVEIDARPETADEEMVTFVSVLMEGIRSHGYRVVADCDFRGLPQRDLEEMKARGWPPPIEEVVLKRDPRGRH